MRKQKWTNFGGTLLAVGTLAGVFACAKHVQKKYGEKPAGFSLDYKGLFEYAFDKFVLNNEKTLDFIGTKLNLDEAEETESHAEV